MLIDSISFDRLLVAGILASLAIAISFGPELRRVLGRLRNRRLVDEVPQPTVLGAESQ